MSILTHFSIILCARQNSSDTSSHSSNPFGRPSNPAGLQTPPADPQNPLVGFRLLQLAYRPFWLALKLLLLGSSPIGDNDYLELERSDDQPEGSEPTGGPNRV